MAEVPSAPRRPTPPWLFLPALIPFGAASGQVTIALPYLMRKQGVLMEDISWLGAVIFVPYFCKFLWTPLLDIWIRRKHWHLWSSLVASVGTALAFLISPVDHFPSLSIVLLITNVAASTSHNALGSLCATTVLPERKGLASGCFSAGQLAAQGLCGGLMLMLVEPPPILHAVLAPQSMLRVGIIFGALMLVTTLLPLVIDEAPPERRPLLPLLGGVLKDVLRTLRTRIGWTGLILCLSPVGAAAASNLFAALGPDYHADAFAVMLATGLCASLANTLGALVGGWMADRMNRRLAYLLGGALCGVCAVALAVAPARPMPYIVGTIAYSIASGLSYATFYAFVFEMIGPSVGATATYGVFVGAANLAIAYVTYFDGRMYNHGGRIGLLGCDAALSIVGVVLVGTLLAWVRPRAPREGLQPARP